MPEQTSGSLKWYAALSRVPFLRSYGGKIFFVAFIGIHMPLLALLAACFTASVPPRIAGQSLVIALWGTVVAAILTFLALHNLLAPVRLSAHALRTYREGGELVELPDHFTDEAGTLLQDTKETLAKLDTTIQRLADFDALTHLPNRDRFTRLLTRRLSLEGPVAPFAVVVLRASALGEVNRAYGRAAGDQLLWHIAERLNHAFTSAEQEQLCLARFASAEFSLMIGGGGTEPLSAAVGTLLHRVQVALQEFAPAANTADVPVWLPHFQQLCAGVAVFPDDAEALHGGGAAENAARQAGTLLRAAEVAVNAASQSQGLAVGARSTLTWQFFTPERDAALHRRLQIEQEMYGAWTRGEMFLHYQPLVTSDAGKIIGVEALLRWEHPRLGNVRPDEFIPIAENNGLIVELGEWVLRTACHQLSVWKEQGLLPLKVAVNLSARQFEQPNLVRVIQSALKDENLPPAQLELEVTETLLLGDEERTLSTLRELRQTGIALSLDDFGIGYASLSRLQRYPFDTLKIDRSFVADIESNPDSQQIVGAIIALAQSLRLDVVAEGVETEAQRQHLQDRGCKLAQGYLFGRPVAPEKIASRLRRHGKDWAMGESPL